ncbi:hypothetical protein [Ectopseudomonas mendocina]|uniref:Uncharacterized protein n=1 Tax=Ectopseudomonas mendocina S5.2 TaxID=1225174 RepID=A0ABN4IUR9_ECTME|nr:hypothetical protein [Pseudomonas mendocina]ALN18606.1 hypothetical protein DW68_008175 [Pseudomonas mendocina S5.2]KES00544.1 hypothetical protein HN51_12040 [Pseudomonas mendocina]QTN46337.1 hypothetical protein H7683_01555 [Pseudomonas mendocina]
MVVETEQIREYLETLTEGELAELFYQVASNLIVKEVYENGDFYQEKICLAKTVYGGTEGVPDRESDIYLVALPADHVRNVNWGGSLNQGGRCTQCMVELASVAKAVVCPICGTENYCT